MTATEALKKAWSGIVQPLLKRPNHVQVAALCFRRANGGKQVLLITSRDTGRWILPKGWPMDGMSASAAALQEAWEEAGVADGQVAANEIGTYAYEKGLDTGGTTICETKVFPVEVKSLTDEFPESDERTRKWVSPAEAAEMVDEPELRTLIRDL